MFTIQKSKLLELVEVLEVRTKNPKIIVDHNKIIVTLISKL